MIARAYEVHLQVTEPGLPFLEITFVVRSDGGNAEKAAILAAEIAVREGMTVVSTLKVLRTCPGHYWHLT